MSDRFHEEVSDSKKEACKTYIEQTKLLVTLASAFLFAPAALIGILKDRAAVGLLGGQQLAWANLYAATLRPNRISARQ